MQTWTNVKLQILKHPWIQYLEKFTEGKRNTAILMLYW